MNDCLKSTSVVLGLATLVIINVVGDLAVQNAGLVKSALQAAKDLESKSAQSVADAKQALDIVNAANENLKNQLQALQEKNAALQGKCGG